MKLTTVGGVLESDMYLYFWSQIFIYISRVRYVFISLELDIYLHIWSYTFIYISGVISLYPRSQIFI